MNSATMLVANWLERDHRYSMRRISVAENEAAAIRAYRLLEVDNLPADDREVARNIWAQWTPPVISRR